MTVFEVRFQHPAAEQRKRASCHCEVEHGCRKMVDVGNIETSCIYPNSDGLVACLDSRGKRESTTVGDGRRRRSPISISSDLRSGFRLPRNIQFYEAMLGLCSVSCPRLGANDPH